MQILLDFINLIIFFIVYKKTDIFYASGSLILTSAFSIFIIYLIHKKIEKSLLINLLLVIIFSGLTFIFHNDFFIKCKVTVIYSGFSLILLLSKFFTQKPLIQILFDKKFNLPNKIWSKLNLFWSVFFAICALVNIYVAFWLPQKVWVNFKVFGLTIITITFLIFNIIYIWKYIYKKQNN